MRQSGAKKTLNEIGREFEVHPNLVGQWKRKVQEHAAGLFEAKRGPKPVDPLADPEKLYAEIGRLKVELNWLKKKSRSVPMNARKNWISDKEQLSVSTQCELAGVTRSGYYGQSKSLMPNTEDLELMKLQVDQAEPENQVIPRHQPERRIDADLGGHVLLPAGIVHQIPD